MTVPRYDFYSLRPSARLPWGALACEGVVAKEGVLRYRTQDGGVRRELVTREDTLSDKSLSSLALTKVTDEHPPVPVTPENVTQFGKGTVLDEVECHNGFVVVRFVVDDANTIRSIQHDGLEELSPGYEVTLLEEPGEHPTYGPYDAVQVDRVYNHVACTKAARAGHDVRFRTDSASMPPGFAWQIREDAVWPEDRDSPYEVQSTQTTKTETKMPQINLDGLALDIPDVQTARAIQQWRKDMEESSGEMSGELATAKEAVAQHQAQIEELEGKIAELAKERDELQGQLDALVAGVGGSDEPAADGENEDMEDMGGEEEPPQNQDEESEKMMNHDSVLEWYKERKELEPLAERFNVDSADDLSNPELKRAICEEFTGEDMSNASDDVVNGAYKGMQIVLSKRDDSYKPSNPSPSGGGKGPRPNPRKRSDGAGREEAAQASYRERLVNAGK